MMIDIKNLYLIFKKIFLFFIILICLIFLSNVLPENYWGENAEFQVLEIIQNTILISTLVVHFQFRKIFVRVSNLLTFLLRQFLILFILYEELSFLTLHSNNLTNSQQEFNLHNNPNLINFEVFSLTIPVINITYVLTTATFLYLLIFFILGYGSYFRCFKKIRYFFLDKRLAIYTFLYLANISIYSISSDFNIGFLQTFNDEIFEVFFYSLLLIDILIKRRIMSEKRFIR